MLNTLAAGLHIICNLAGSVGELQKGKMISNNHRHTSAVIRYVKSNQSLDTLQLGIAHRRSLSLISHAEGKASMHLHETDGASWILHRYYEGEHIFHVRFAV